MCGIIGYIGERNAIDNVIDGLKKVEYRGYDSAGIAYCTTKEIRVVKDSGTIAKVLEGKKIEKTNKAIGHTRWATHGPPCKENAHPHLDCKKKIAIVHNGIIENYQGLKNELLKKGHLFSSETDSEVVAHLIEEELKTEKDKTKAIKNALKKLEGTYAIGVMLLGEENLYVAKKYAPLIIGIGEKENFFASDIPAIMKYTKTFVVLEDGDFAKITKDLIEVWNKEDKKIEPRKININWTEDMAQKEGYPHFMLKEIFEQPQIVKNALSTDIENGLLLLKNAKKIALVGCGTSYYASLLFSYLMQKEKKLCPVYIASEYDEWSTKDEDLIIALSQSGETADTLKVVREARTRGTKILAITNVVGSSLALQSDALINIGAGPEICVVATKSFLAQIIVLYRLYYSLFHKEKELLELQKAPEIIKNILEKSQEEIQALAKTLKNCKDFLFISRGLGQICALEGALKLKEITYLHAEAYPAGELKHGPISMIEKNLPIIFIAPSYEKINKMINSIMECKARGAMIIALTDSKEVLDQADIKIELPAGKDEQFLIYYIVPLQILAYYLAVYLNRNPDKPRNLAKSVTVE
ncbi:MAG: glutamine--fructose-6-phosphate transaminase (isomerizing) [Candidatus Anstonellaceae archaeon]